LEKATKNIAPVCTGIGGALIHIAFKQICILKNALFFEKCWKIATALEAPPPNPVDLGRLGALPPGPQLVTLTQLTYYF